MFCYSCLELIIEFPAERKTDCHAPQIRKRGERERAHATASGRTLFPSVHHHPCTMIIYIYFLSWFYPNSSISSIFLLVVKGWNRQHHNQTIHSTEMFTAMNLFKILCIVTWAWSFLTLEVMKAVRGQKHPLEAKNGMKELIY